MIIMIILICVIFVPLTKSIYQVMSSISVPNVKELPTVIENVKHGIGPITNKDAKKSNNKRIIKERYKYIVTLYAHE